MSTPQPPYGAPQQPGYGPPVYPAYQKPVPSRRRPSGWWFVAGALLMLAGVAIGTLLIVQTVRAFTETDATIRADGQPHSVSVDADQDRMVWIHPGEPQTCSIVDTATGEDVVLERPGASYTKSVGSGEWEGSRTFDPGSGDLEVTCDASGGEIQIGPAPEFGAFFGGLAAGILAAVLLGGAGFVLLIVIAVLYATGRPRNVPAPQ
jgi:hypothetical protein